jgi:hypothetical protein
MFDTYVGTTKGIFRIEGSALEPLGLDGERVSAVHAWRASGGTTVLAGTYESGLYRREDGRRRWERVEAGLTAPCFRCIGPDPLEPNALLAGTEPARLFRSRDGGRTWRELDGIRRIEEHEQWFLPYSPRAGALRNVWAPPGSSATLFASVEVGGLLRSDDGGEAWRCDPVVDDDDIHYVTGDPRDPSLLYAARATAAERGRSSRPTTRARCSSRRRGRTFCSPVPRRTSAAKGASWSPTTAATPGSRPRTASTCRCRTWSSCSCPRPTATSGRSAPAAVCCARRPANGTGARPFPPTPHPSSRWRSCRRLPSPEQRSEEGSPSPPRPKVPTICRAQDSRVLAVLEK